MRMIDKSVENLTTTGAKDMRTANNDKEREIKKKLKIFK